MHHGDRCDAESCCCLSLELAVYGPPSLHAAATTAMPQSSIGRAFDSIVFISRRPGVCGAIVWSLKPVIPGGLGTNIRGAFHRCMRFRCPEGLQSNVLIKMCWETSESVAMRICYNRRVSFPCPVQARAVLFRRSCRSLRLHAVPIRVITSREVCRTPRNWSYIWCVVLIVDIGYRCCRTRCLQWTIADFT